MMRIKNALFKNFAVVGSLILFAKGFGFLREILIAGELGTSVEADIYLQTFAIATLIFTAFGMAISHINIPHMTLLILKKDKIERNNYINILFSSFFITTLSIAIILAIFSPIIVKIILPALGDKDKILANRVFLIMLPTLIFISLTYISTSILQAHKRFFITTIIGIPFNLLIISYLLVTDTKVELLGIMTTLGWLLQFLIQIPFLIKEEYRLKPVLKRDSNIKGIFKRLMPIVIANAVIQLCLIIDQTFANNLGEGLTSALRYGSNLFITITTIFIFAISTVSFPDLSGYHIKKDNDKIRETLAYILKIILIIGLPYLIIVVFFNKEIIRIIYMRGEFDLLSVERTSFGFLAYSFLIIGYVVQEVFTRLFYSMKQYKYPFYLGFGCIILNLILTAVVSKKYGIHGIVLTTVFVMTLYAISMTISVIKKVGNFINRDLVFYLMKLLLCGIIMSIVIFIFKANKSDYSNIMTIFFIILGIVAYGIATIGTGTYKEVLMERIKERKLEE
jgi:putative peptidoglycan lipid II flippase